MSLAHYERACVELAGELRASLTDNDIQWIHERLTGHSVIEWMRWKRDHFELIINFVADTPSERKKKKKYQEDQRFLAMAALQHLKQGEALLEVINTHPLRAGGSYRQMAAIAGNAYQQLIDADIPYWPFDGIKSPFKDDPARFDHSREDH
jgi:hypothetical protein